MSRGGEWSSQASEEVIAGRQTEDVRRTSQAEETACGTHLQGKSLLYIPGTKEAGVLDARERRGDRRWAKPYSAP